MSADNVFTEHRDFIFLPSVFINKKELFFGQFSGKDKLIIVGLPQVLSQMKVIFFSNYLTKNYLLYYFCNALGYI